MTDVTRIIEAVARGERQAANDLLPLVYDELRRVAAQKIAHEPAGLTLQPTALVHEAYLRLVDVPEPQQWDSRRHFFAAAAEAMRRILVESARRRKSLKRGGDRAQQELIEDLIAAPDDVGDLEALDEALTQFAQVDPEAHAIVQLRCFAGLSLDEAADVQGVSRRTAARLWAYARAWLGERLQRD
jgi:RNA polymerase sigma factor (TIGR02999 family)